MPLRYASADDKRKLKVGTWGRCVKGSKADQRL